MMTFKQFLSEEDGDMRLEDLLRRDCTPFLNSADTRLMYRGIKGVNSATIHVVFDGEEIMVTPKNVRTDRKPKDTSMKRHEMLNNWFAKHFDVRARSETVFCVGERSIGITGEYGVPCAIFPIGEFKFIWSPRIDDLFQRILDSMPPAASVDDEQFNKWLVSLDYTDKNFIAALGSGHEIMVFCKSYYAILIGQKIGLTDKLRKMMRYETWKSHK